MLVQKVSFKSPRVCTAGKEGREKEPKQENKPSAPKGNNDFLLLLVSV